MLIGVFQPCQRRPFVGAAGLEDFDAFGHQDAPN
jgi:hypothetical protein